MSRTLYPTLLIGLEDLASQVEKMKKEGDERVNNRFNACAYLAEYLMRNNPKYNPDKTKGLTTLYTSYSKKEKLERVLTNRKALLRSLYTRAGGATKDMPSQIKSFIDSLDQDLKLKVNISEAINLVTAY